MGGDHAIVAELGKLPTTGPPALDRAISGAAGGKDFFFFFFFFFKKITYGLFINIFFEKIIYCNRFVINKHVFLFSRVFRFEPFFSPQSLCKPWFLLKQKRFKEVQPPETGAVDTPGATLGVPPSLNRATSGGEIKRLGRSGRGVFFFDFLVFFCLFKAKK